MPSNKPIFTLRTDKIILEKLHIIADHNGRSDNKELEWILKTHIKTYEQEHGKIVVPGGSE